MDGDGADADEEEVRWWPRREAYPIHHGNEEGELWGTAASHNDEYAAHNETFDWHDSDGDGLLNHVELGLYLLPASNAVHKGYAEEESFRLLEVLRYAARLGADASGGEPNGAAPDNVGDISDSFALEHVLSAGSQFLATFDSSIHSFLHDLALDQGNERDL